MELLTPELVINKPPHRFRNLSKDELEELYSNYLISNWSFSKVTAFARNEKAFEMKYIYGIHSRRSATEVAGSAYHKALDHFFLELKSGNVLDLASLEIIAFNYIEEIQPNKWKIQKTTPTIEDCILKANKTVAFLLKSFLKENDVYLEELEEVLEVEVVCEEFLTINGFDIPMPCNAKIDLLIRTTAGKVVIIDHKSKSTFTDEKDLKFSIGKQAITYVLSLESKYGIKADEVWFIENKTSENRDGSPQISCFKIEITSEIRKLYEVLLYEPLNKMLSAVSDPSYTYLINESDNFIDKAEVYEFWAQTLMADVDDFNIPDSKKELIQKRLERIRNASLGKISPDIIKHFRAEASGFIQFDLSNKNMTPQERIEHTLKTLGMLAKVAHRIEGYSSDTYLMEMTAGTNLASVFKYKLDIANALNVPSIRMNKDLFIYEGKSYLAFESPKTREKDLFFDPKHLVGVKIPLGIDNFNKMVIWDLNNPSTPHMLICGSTGSGKSVCIISILEYAKLAGIDSIIICDPKFEFTKYKGGNIEVYNEIEEIETVLDLMVDEMNDLVKTGRNRKTLIIFDEFADALASSRKGPELDVYENQVIGLYKSGLPKTKRVKVQTNNSLEQNLKVLLQKGRSSGFRIIAATQRASVNVITGDAKVNFPVQICFKVPKEIDSKVVLDEPGAESLSGKGDGLIKSPEYFGITRFQAFYKPN